MGGDERLCTHCVIVFVALDEAEGNPIEVPTWVPRTDDDRRLAEYATQVMALSKGIEQTEARYRDASPFRTRAGNEEGRLPGLPGFGAGRCRSAARDALGLHELVAPVRDDQDRTHDSCYGALGIPATPLSTAHQ